MNASGPFGARRKGQKKENSERWLLTYSDLITLLLVLFIVMYAMSQIDMQKFSLLTASLQRAFNPDVLKGMDNTAVGGEYGTSRLVPESVTPPTIVQRDEGLMGSDFSRIGAALDELKAEQGIGDRITAAITQEGILLRLEGNLLFPAGEAALQPNAGAVLDKLAGILRPLPNKLRVEGHTDNVAPNVPAYPTNWELSTTRAVTIVRYLTEVAGIQPDRLYAVGRGEQSPVKDNASRTGRAENRRVDIYILYPSAEAKEDILGDAVKPDALSRQEGR